MIPNNNFNILPWYLSPDKQNHKKDYAFGSIFCLATPDRQLLPFQIIRNTRANTVQSVILCDLNGNELLNITSQMSSTGLELKRFITDGYDLIIYPGVLPMAIETPEGRYYAKISDGVETWYSEVFTVIRNLDSYLKIQYWDVENFELSYGHIDYSGAYKSTVYLPTQLGKPDYPFEEDVSKRDGYQFVEKQISEKTYKFTFLATEYLCDAMRLIRMHDYIEITNKGEVYPVDTFLITPKWQDQGDLAAVQAEFECATVIKKIGRGTIPGLKGDFNKDFNTDFKNNN